MSNLRLKAWIPGKPPAKWDAIDSLIRVAPIDEGGGWRAEIEAYEGELIRYRVFAAPVPASQTVKQ